MSGIKMFGPFFDSSGYAEASRQYALAIAGSGYPITLSSIEFSEAKPELGEDGEVLRSLNEKPIEYDKVLVHSTPDTWRTIVKDEPNDKRLIGLTVWETSKLHPVWRSACNQVDEVWVPCSWNQEVFVDSGVTVPVHVFPHVLPPSLGAEEGTDSVLAPMEIQDVRESDFVFYAIFRWQERKNPRDLIEAYIAAFAGRRDVALVLKTHFQETDEDAGVVRALIQEIKQRVNVMRYPKIVPLVETMSKSRIDALHQRGDCFVQLQHSEGWGLPHFEAAAAGNPVITTGYGGVTDFLPKKSAFLLDYTLRPATGMQWSPYYSAEGWWASPDLKQAVDVMRWVYANRTEAKARGRTTQVFVRERFSRQKVGAEIAEHLRELDS